MTRHALPRPARAMRPSEILDLLPEGILLFDARGRCAHANGLAVARWGRPTLVGQPAATVFAGREEEIARRVEEALGEGPVPAQVARLALPGGDVQVLRVRGGALVLAHPSGPQPPPAPPAEAVRRQISHDLIQPLSSIANYAELIRLVSPGEEAKGFAAKIGEIARKAAADARTTAAAAAARPEDGDEGGRGTA